MTPEEFRQFGYKIIDWIADYRENLSDKRVMSDVLPHKLVNNYLLTLQIKSRKVLNKY
ncbi:MAG: hypothetical protein IPK14_27920 [Blastocatellia bacterium]|nr:hypothetical protein [Blastocatellia bacterium]